MSVVDSLARIADWLEDNVCEGVLLKPMDVDAPQDGEFDYELVKPVVHTLIIPTHKNKPPGMRATIPSIVVQLMNCKDGAQGREIALRLSFTAFDPGLHKQDVIVPVETGDEPHDGFGPVYQLGDGEFTVNYDGWRDSFNFMDRAIRIIEDAGGIGDYDLKPGSEIAFGNYEFQDSADELFPFWLCWCSMTVIEPIVRGHGIPNTRNEELEAIL